MTITKASEEYGWQVIRRDEYSRKLEHEYAGPGTPLDPEAPGFWVMGHEDGVGTVLYTGVQIIE